MAVKERDTEVLLEKELTFWDSNQDSLRKRYPNRWLLIRGDEVLGDYETYDELIVADREMDAPLIKFVDVPPSNSANMPSISVASN